MSKKNTLGRGLDSLLNVTLGSLDENEAVEQLLITDIEPGLYQPRTEFEDESLKELAESIKEHGVIQPILVRKKGLRYEIVAGERRWRASLLAGLDNIPGIVREINDENALAIGLIENIQRQNLNPIDEAQGLDRLQKEFGLTHERIANAVGRSRSSITNTMRLLTLPESVQNYLRQRKLDMGHARALITLPVMQQLELAEQAVRNGWSVREIEKKVAVQTSLKPRIKSIKNREIIDLEEKLSNYLGLPVTLKEKTKKGAGVISFAFNSYEELDQLLNKLQFKDQDVI